MSTHDPAVLLDAIRELPRGGACSPAPYADGGVRVAALVHDDDHRNAVTFDAAPFFRSADPDVILAIAWHEWTGSYEADRVAEEAAQYDPRVEALFIVKPEGVGFEVHVDPDDAIAFLTRNRPELAARVVENSEAP
jgi:hypothetical protein